MTRPGSAASAASTAGLRAGSMRNIATPPPPANWSVPTGLDVIALRSRNGSGLTVRVVNPQNRTLRATVVWGRSFAAAAGFAG